MSVSSRHVVAILALLGSFGWSLPLGASGLLAPAEHNRLVAQTERRPMIFFVARGAADSCGPGCSEWIAAVGRIEIGTAQQFRDFIEGLNRPGLPIFFHSPG